MRTAGSRGKRFLRAGVIVGLLVGLLPSFCVWAEVQPESTPSSSSAATERGELFVALLKRRAQRILEAHRAPPPPLVTASVGTAIGYESNVKLDGANQGDLFAEETLALILGPTITSWLRAEFSYNFSNTHYLEFTDSNLFIHTAGAVLQWRPWRPVRMDLGYEYGLLNFPFDTGSSFFDHRVKAALLLAQSSWWTHKLHAAYQMREYDTRKALDAGASSIEGMNRQDTRDLVGYEWQFRLAKSSARVGAEIYRNYSNDQFQEYYDWDDLKIRGSLTRVLAAKWLGTLTASTERRNYQRRNVPAINVAERDDLVTVGASLIYQWTRHASVTSSLTYRHQDSNDPRLDFTDWISQVGMTLSF